MQAIGRQPQQAPDGAPHHYGRHRPEQTTLYRLVQQHAASFIAHTEASTGAELPRFVKDEFDAFLECGMHSVRASRVTGGGSLTHDSLPTRALQARPAGRAEAHDGRTGPAPPQDAPNLTLMPVKMPKSFDFVPAAGLLL